MAKKLDVDIDPGKFLDSFRPEMPAPASPGSLGTDGNTSAKEGQAGGKNRKQRWARMPRKMKRNTWNASSMHRESPCVRARPAYIRKSYHERIQRIVQVIGKNGLTLSVYVDRVLEQHFREYEEVIRRLYKKNYEDIY